MSVNPKLQRNIIITVYHLLLLISLQIRHNTSELPIYVGF